MITSALGAIMKEDSGKVRLLHDASRPHGRALNDFAVNPSFSYQTLYQATSSIKKGYYLAKLDLSQAYRSVKLHHSTVISISAKGEKTRNICGCICKQSQK